MDQNRRRALDACEQAIARLRKQADTPARAAALDLLHRHLARMRAASERDRLGRPTENWGPAPEA